MPVGGDSGIEGGSVLVSEDVLTPSSTAGGRDGGTSDGAQIPEWIGDEYHTDANVIQEEVWILPAFDPRRGRRRAHGCIKSQETFWTCRAPIRSAAKLGWDPGRTA